MKTTSRFIAAIGVVLLAACSSSHPGVEGAERGAGQEVPGLRTNWDTWFPDAISVSATDTRYRQMPFQAIEPSGLGNTPRIFMSPTGLAVAYVADSPTYGRVVVVESAPDIADPRLRHASYLKRASKDLSMGWHGTAKLTTVKGAIEALINIAQDGSWSTIEFVVGNTQITVLGPSLSPQQAQAIADGL